MTVSNRGGPEADFCKGYLPGKRRYVIYSPGTAAWAVPGEYITYLPKGQVHNVLIFHL